MVDPQNAHSRVTGSCACALLVFRGPNTQTSKFGKCMFVLLKPTCLNSFPGPQKYIYGISHVGSLHVICCVAKF